VHQNPKFIITINFCLKKYQTVHNVLHDHLTEFEVYSFKQCFRQLNYYIWYYRNK